MRWVANSPTVRSSNSKTFWMNSLVAESKTPFSLPRSTIILISSSLTSSSSALGSTPSRRRMPLVEAVSTATTGAQMVERVEISPDRPRASVSAFFMARRLGTSSPKTRVM